MFRFVFFIGCMSILTGIAHSALPKAAQIEQKEALIIEALKNKSSINCPVVIKSTNELQQLTNEIPAILYYYRGSCYSSAGNHQKALQDLDQYFAKSHKKGTVRNKALVLHDQESQKVQRIIQEQEKQKRVAAAETAKRKRVAAETEARNKRNLDRIQQLEPLRLAAIELHQSLCGINFKEVLEKNEDSKGRSTHHLSASTKILNCKPSGEFHMYKMIWDYRRYSSSNKAVIEVDYDVLHANDMRDVDNINIGSGKCFSLESENSVKFGIRETKVKYYSNRDPKVYIGAPSHKVNNLDEIEYCYLSTRDKKRLALVMDNWKKFSVIKAKFIKQNVRFDDVLADLKEQKSYYYDDQHTPDYRKFFVEQFD